jgi:hypothetical protein
VCLLRGTDCIFNTIHINPSSQRPCRDSGGLSPVSYSKSPHQWPRGLRRGFAAALLPGLWVRIPPRPWMFVLCFLYKDNSEEHKRHEEGWKDLNV